MAAETALADVGRKIRHAAQTGTLTVRYREATLAELSAAGVDDVDVSNLFRNGSYTGPVISDEWDQTIRLRLSGRLDDGKPIEFEIDVFKADDGDGDSGKINARIVAMKLPLGMSERRGERARRTKLEVVRKRRK